MGEWRHSSIVRKFDTKMYVSGHLHALCLSPCELVSATNWIRGWESLRGSVSVQVKADRRPALPRYIIRF
jgi:hypothetical protein